MIAVLVCDRNERELALIARNCREQIARGSGEQFQLESVAGDAGLASAAENEKLVDLLYYEFQKGQTVSALRSFRRRSGDTMVMLITDQSVSPLEYLRPGVAPDSLLLRPVSEKQLETVNSEFMESFFDRFSSKETEASFVVDTREEKIFIPFSYIYYFEARDKKLFVRAKNEEYAFYDTMEALGKRLPDFFQRCHRSYIVNTTKIVRVFPAGNYIELSEGIGVPVSRSYKSLFRSGQS